jgi:integrase
MGSELVPYEDNDAEVWLDASPTPGELEPARPDDTLDPETMELIRDGIAKNTDNAYRWAWERFVRWCAETDRTHLPTSPTTLANYVTHLSGQTSQRTGKPLSPSTIKQAMAVISVYNQAAGFPWGRDHTKPARAALQGHQKRNKGRRAKQAPPITLEVLQRMVGALDRSTLTGKRDALLLVLGWCLAGRRSEIADLLIEDVEVKPDGSGLRVLIEASKTDQAAEGQWVPVPRGEHVDTDPVGLLHDWLAALERQLEEQELPDDGKTGPLFRAITQHGKFYRHGSITGQSVAAIVKRTARAAGIPNWHLFSGHSLRSGFATEAANSGVPMPLFARQGRWKETSPVVAGYVRTADMERDNPLRRMGL